MIYAHLVVVVRAVAEVEARHVHARAQQLLDHLHAARHGPERADHLHYGGEFRVNRRAGVARASRPAMGG